MSIKKDLKDLVIPNDSLGMLDLLIDLEDRYDIIILQSEAAELRTKEELIALIERKTKNVAINVGEIR